MLVFMREKDPNRFKEHRPIKLWASVLDVEMPKKRLRNEIINAAVELQQDFMGFFDIDPNRIDVATSFTHTRNPYKGNEVPSIASCKRGMDHLAGMLGTTHRLSLIPPGMFRVVLGLEEGGRIKTKDSHPIEDIGSILGDGFEITPAETILVLRNKSRSVYEASSEKAAVITGDVSNATKVYELAHSIYQERFIVEDFGAQKAYRVETSRCT